jgi:glycosyltransferase involved in cell wall biosynthesis
MFETVKELVMAERAMGIEAQMLHPSARDGGQKYPVLEMADVLRFHKWAGRPNIPRFTSDIYTPDNSKLCMASYDWAIREADIQVMHWKGDNMTEKLRPLVFCSHGSYPEYCLSTELFTPQFGSPFTGTIQRTKDADLTVAFTKRQEWFLKQLGTGDVRHIPFGLDLARWRPNGSRIKDMEGKPVCGYLEQWRDFKLPDTFLHAIKYASDSLPEIGMCIAGADEDPHLMNKLATHLNIDHRFTPAHSCMAHITYPEHFYRAFHIFFNPVLTGESSRTGRESMACGTPAINLATRPEWDAEPFFARAGIFDPISAGEAIIKIWEAMEKDEKAVRREARQRAVKAWDIRNTADAFVKCLAEVQDKFDIDSGLFNADKNKQREAPENPKK